MTIRFLPPVTVALTLMFGLAGVPGNVAAQTTAAVQETGTGDLFIPQPGGWETYVNNRFGTQLSYPADLFSPDAASENGDGRRFVAEDAQLEIFGWDNAEGETASSLRERLVGTQGYENVTYNRSGGSWLVLSGFRGDNIFYEKYFFRNGTIQAFGMEFPEDEKPFYAPVVERIEDSFRAGG